MAEVSFAELLVGVSDRKDTGVLELNAEQIKTRIYFQEGVPVFADGGAVGDTLGRILVRHGRLTEEQYEQAIAHMKQNLQGSQQIRLGECLVQLGMLRPEEVFDALRLQVREKMVSCFKW